MSRERRVKTRRLALLACLALPVAFGGLMWDQGALPPQEPEELGRITDFELGGDLCKIYTTKGVYAGQGHECRDLQVNATLRKNWFNELEVDAGAR